MLLLFFYLMCVCRIFIKQSRIADENMITLGAQATLSGRHLHASTATKLINGPQDHTSVSADKEGQTPLPTRDVHGNGIPNGTGNPVGMGIKHRIWNGNGREWETTSLGMGITCTPMGIYSQRFYIYNFVSPIW